MRVFTNDKVHVFKLIELNCEHIEDHLGSKHINLLVGTTVENCKILNMIRIIAFSHVGLIKLSNAVNIFCSISILSGDMIFFR